MFASCNIDWINCAAYTAELSIRRSFRIFLSRFIENRLLPFSFSFSGAHFFYSPVYFPETKLVSVSWLSTHSLVKIQCDSPRVFLSFVVCTKNRTKTKWILWSLRLCVRCKGWSNNHCRILWMFDCHFHRVETDNRDGGSTSLYNYWANRLNCECCHLHQSSKRFPIHSADEWFARLHLWVAHPAPNNPHHIWKSMTLSIAVASMMGIVLLIACEVKIARTSFMVSVTARMFHHFGHIRESMPANGAIMKLIRFVHNLLFCFLANTNISKRNANKWGLINQKKRGAAINGGRVPEISILRRSRWYCDHECIIQYAVDRFNRKSALENTTISPGVRYRSPRLFDESLHYESWHCS